MPGLMAGGTAGSEMLQTAILSLTFGLISLYQHCPSFVRGVSNIGKGRLVENLGLHFPEIACPGYQENHGWARRRMKEKAFLEFVFADCDIAATTVEMLPKPYLNDVVWHHILLQIKR